MWSIFGHSATFQRKYQMSLCDSSIPNIVVTVLISKPRDEWSQ